jgi:hypothetical protein
VDATAGASIVSGTRRLERQLQFWPVLPGRRKGDLANLESAIAPTLEGKQQPAIRLPDDRYRAQAIALQTRAKLLLRPHATVDRGGNLLPHRHRTRRRSAAVAFDRAGPEGEAESPA